MLVPLVLAPLQGLGVLKLKCLLGFNETADPVRFLLSPLPSQATLELGQSNINCAHAGKVGPTR